MKPFIRSALFAGLFVSSLVHADSVDGVWSRIAQTGPVPPPGLELTAMAFDSARQRAVYFAPLVGETWALDLDGTPVWSQITTTGTPPSPQLCAAFYDPQVDRLIVIGDTSSSVWALSLGDATPAWTILSAPNRFVAGNSSFAYKPATWELFDYGGTYSSGTEFYNALSSFSALFLTWGTLSLPTEPAGRAAASLLYDPNGGTERLILHGGIATPPFTGHIANHDTWAFQLPNVGWTRLADGPPMAFAATIYDPARTRMVVFNRDAWQLSLRYGYPETWRQLSPDGTMDGGCDGMAGIYDPVNDRMVLYGGNGCTQTWQLLFDPSTPALASLVARDVTPSRVALTWEVTPGLEASVERTFDDSWSALAQVTSDGVGRVRYEDDQVVPGDRYGYRLRWLEGSREVTAGEVWIDVPRSSGLQLLGVTPNPASGPMEISFALPSSGDVGLEVFDVRGRRIGEAKHLWLPAGSHVVPLTSGVTFPAGVYLARLTFGGTSLWSRAVSMR